MLPAVIVAIIVSIVVTKSSATPIRVHQPVAVTQSSAASPAQINYFLKHYPSQSAIISSYRIPDPEQAKYQTVRNRQKTAESKYFLPTIAPNHHHQQSEAGYDFYFPQSDDILPDQYEPSSDSYLRELQPPRLLMDEPNYYAESKPKKGTKKYDGAKKQVNIVAGTKKLASDTFEDYYTLNGGADDTAASQKQPQYIVSSDGSDGLPRQTPKSAIRTLRQDELNTGEYLPDIFRNGKDRVEFQMHGFAGPNSYKFGFDTGKG